MKKLIVSCSVLALLLVAANAALAAPNKEAAYYGQVELRRVAFHGCCQNGNGQLKTLDGVNADSKFLVKAGIFSAELQPLVFLGGKEWVYDGEEFACPHCGNTEWVTYSNQDGSVVGANPQLHNPNPNGPEETLAPLSVSASVDLSESVDVYVQLLQDKYEQKLFRWKTFDLPVSKTYGSVTATTQDQIDGNACVVPNSNHFTYAKLAVADLEEGVELVLVEGNKINEVGKALVKSVPYGDVNKLELSFPTIHEIGFGAVANTTLWTPSNGNVHSGQGDKNFKHNNVSVIDMPEADKDGFIYLYVHGDMSFVIGDKIFTGYDSEYGEQELVEEGVEVGRRFVETRTSFIGTFDYKDDETVFTVTTKDGTDVPEASWAELTVGETYTVNFVCPFCEEDEDQDVTIKEDGSKVSFGVHYCVVPGEEVIEGTEKIKDGIITVVKWLKPVVTPVKK